MPRTFAQFQNKTSPASTDFLVGYEVPAADGSERRFELTALSQFFSNVSNWDSTGVEAGRVPTADGAGGVTWESVTAEANVGVGSADEVVDAQADGSVKRSGLLTADVETVTGSQAKADAAETSAKAYSELQLAAHQLDETNIHGIADTQQLETLTGSQAKVDAHNAETTSVHGITDTSALETQSGAQIKADAAEANANTYTDTSVSNHNLATTTVHGIADTSALETQTGAQTKADTAQSNAEATAAAALSAHDTDTTGIHGITDTAELALKDGSNMEAGAIGFSQVTQADIQGATGDVKTLFASKEYVDQVATGAVILQGDWNASTNTPDITGTTTTGHGWRVSVAGSTNLGGITDWEVNDVAVKTATGWLKIDNSETSAVWGAIGGTLSNQADLQAELDLKANTADLGGLASKDQVDNADVDSGASTVGQVLQSDGDGTASWGFPSAVTTDTITSSAGNNLQLNTSDNTTYVQFGSDLLTDFVHGQATNVVMGIDAMGGKGTAAEATMVRNIAIGHSAMRVAGANSFDNIAIGYESQENDGIGARAATYNVSVGNLTLKEIGQGDYNTAIGHLAGTKVRDGVYNTFLGYGAASVNQEPGNYNTFLGVFAGRDAQGAVSNTGVGDYALAEISNGQYNMAMGESACQKLTTGDYNIGIGGLSCYNNVTGSNNTAVGHEALKGTAAASQSNLVAFGYQAGFSVTAATDCTFIGYQAGYSSTDAVGCTYVGDSAGRGNTSQDYVTAVGFESVYTGSGDGVYVGYRAGYSLAATSNGNVVIGNTALEDCVAANSDSNVIIGSGAAANCASTVTSSTVIGASAYNTAGGLLDSTVIIGAGSGANMTNAQRCTIVGVGSYTGASADRIAIYNTSLGFQNLTAITSNAIGNTAIGYQAGRNVDNGAYNVFLGYEAGEDHQDGDYNIIIGANAEAANPDGDYQLNIGDTITGDLNTGDVTIANDLTVTNDLNVQNNLDVDGQINGNVNALTSSTSIAIDMDNGNDQTVTLAHATTFGAPSNGKAGSVLAMEITQDATGGRTASWNTAFRASGGELPTLSTSPGAIDEIVWRTKDGTNWNLVSFSPNVSS